MHLFLIVGRKQDSGNDFTTSLLAAENEAAAQAIFESEYLIDADAEEIAETKFEYDVSVLVGTYAAPGMLEIPSGCDWHLAGIQGLPYDDDVARVAAAVRRQAV